LTQIEARLRGFVRADETLMAFLELESAIRGSSQFPAPVHWQETPLRHRSVRLKSHRPQREPYHH
jgi:hypothetical protein